VKCLLRSPLSKNAVKKIKNINNHKKKSYKYLKSSSKITIARLYTGGTGTESMGTG
jgi:hypothetical protein